MEVLGHLVTVPVFSLKRTQYKGGLVVLSQFNLGYFFLGKRGRKVEVKKVLREGLGMFYSSPSISGVGKAGVLLRTQRENANSFHYNNQICSVLMEEPVSRLRTFSPRYFNRTVEI